MTAIPPDDKSFLIKFICIAGLAMAFFFTIALLVTGCAPKHQDELADLFADTMKHGEGLRVQIDPVDEKDHK